MVFDQTLKSRIGTCRSERTFDIPHNLKKTEIGTFLAKFEFDDLIDMFCMCEARIVGITKSSTRRSDDISIGLLLRYFWKEDTFAKLRPGLERLGLYTSPDYVRFGQSLLLV